MLNVLLSYCSLLIVFYLQGRALFKKVVFFLAGNTVMEVTPCADTKVFHFVYLRWRATLLEWTPSEIIHLFDCLVDREDCKFVDEFFVKRTFL